MVADPGPRLVSAHRAPALHPEVTVNATAPLLRMDDYTPQAKAYWWATTLVGAAALGLAVTSVGQLDPGAVLQILGGTAIAALTGLFPVRIPGTKISLAGAELIIVLMPAEDAGAQRRPAH